MKQFKIKGKIEIFPQKGGWTFIRVPTRITKALMYRAERGLIPIEATVGTTTWNTSLMPMGDGTHFIALNAKVRNRQAIEVGDVITVSFGVR